VVGISTSLFTLCIHCRFVFVQTLTMLDKKGNVFS